MNTKVSAKKIFIGASIIGVLALFMALFYWSKPTGVVLEVSSGVTDVSQVKVGPYTYTVDVAKTDEERVRGLSGLEELRERHGLLFVFEKSAVQGFWMKDMNFPIDIVWIDEDLKVIGVERSVSPETFPEVFQSPGSVRYVLEVNSGEASALKFGDSVELVKKL